MNLNSISIVIPIKEDTTNLKELLENLKTFNFNDIHVVDSLQCAENKNLCQQFNATYRIFEWDGNFPKKRNWYLEQADLREWVLFLDSDERLTKAFVNELREIRENGTSGFAVHYNNTFLGKELRFGDIMTKIPLIRRDVRFERIEEDSWSPFDMEIHEHPDINSNEVSRISSRIEHLEKTSLNKYISKHNSYSDWEANRITSGMSIGNRNLRTRIKYFVLRSRFSGIYYFLFAYIFRFGFLDGRAGFTLALMKAQYFYWIYVKVRNNNIQ